MIDRLIDWFTRVFFAVSKVNKKHHIIKKKIDKLNKPLLLTRPLTLTSITWPAFYFILTQLNSNLFGSISHLPPYSIPSAQTHSANSKRCWHPTSSLMIFSNTETLRFWLQSHLPADGRKSWESVGNRWCQRFFQYLSDPHRPKNPSIPRWYCSQIRYKHCTCDLF